MSLKDWLEIAALVGAGLAIVFTGALSWRKARFSAKDDLIATLQDSVKEARERAADAAKQYEENRNYHHDKAQKDQELVSRLTKENTEYRVRTDMTPLLEFAQQQTEINKEILGHLRNFSSVLKQKPERRKKREVHAKVDT